MPQHLLEESRYVATSLYLTNISLFSGSRSSYTPRERFPNVYDKMEEARHASAFIGGVKVWSNSSLSYYY